MTSEDEQKAIEDEFLKSWDWIEEYFKKITSRWPEYEPIRGFITELRQKGYDRKFRAGQSMDQFSVSRRSRYGLLEEHHSVWFEVVIDKHRMKVRYLVRFSQRIRG